ALDLDLSTILENAIVRRRAEPGHLRLAIRRGRNGQGQRDESSTESRAGHPALSTCRGIRCTDRISHADSTLSWTTPSRHFRDPLRNVLNIIRPQCYRMAAKSQECFLCATNHRKRFEKLSPTFPRCKRL